MIRSRLAGALAVALTICLGLASRKFPPFPEFLGKYPGDALWALMVFFALGVIFPHARALHLALGALAVSFDVEFSQLYQPDWLRAIRRTTPGHLVLGSGFGWLDLPAYTVGVVIGVLIDPFVPRGKRC